MSTPTVQAPQSFIVRQECEKAAWQHGFRRPMTSASEGWAAFASTTVPGTLSLAAAGDQGPWFLALDHGGVIEAIGLVPTAMAGPGLARYSFPSLGALYGVLPRVYALSASLPDAPLQQFVARIRGLPRTTEAEGLVVRRIGQEIFRASLMEYWRGQCPLTGISDQDLLRASHIIPWSQCQNDGTRLDVYNGLLLSALWDAAFDRGLVTFDAAGQPQFSPRLSRSGQAELRWQEPIPLTPKHQTHLAWHRQHVFGKVGP
ncbi:MAG: restriction endonuclease [Candidatus Synechococcus spongiarum 142]|uniref:Restriction endonuclease n=1 Tax=Candidatus Synechococcus spongiarum 142 TaxID=1608213 RepID=A0A6N3X5G9_9SYNE|nr:MAG: restriction endonuclease [Candidatus Synechococcus spongiarum 142]